MATVSGLGSQFGLKKETTYGTAVVPDRGMQILSESLKLTIERIEAPTLKGGNYLMTSPAWRVGGRMGGGDVQTYLWQSGAALLWEAMLGTNVTVGAGPYTHTASIGATLPGYTLEVGMGGASASFARKKLIGAKVTSWELDLQVKQMATLGLTWVYQDETFLASTASTATYPAGQKPYVFVDGVATVAAASPGCVTGIKFNGNNNLLADQFCLGQSLISEPVRNGMADISGVMTVMFDGTVTNYARYTAGTEVALVLTMTGTSPATSVITANVRIDGSTPVVSGPQAITVDIPFRCIGSSTDASGFQIVTTNSDPTA